MVTKSNFIEYVKQVGLSPHSKSMSRKIRGVFVSASALSGVSYHKIHFDICLCHILNYGQLKVNGLWCYSHWNGDDVPSLCFEVKVIL